MFRLGGWQIRPAPRMRASLVSTSDSLAWMTACMMHPGIVAGYQLVCHAPWGKSPTSGESNHKTLTPNVTHHVRP